MLSSEASFVLRDDFERRAREDSSDRKPEEAAQREGEAASLVEADERLRAKAAPGGDLDAARGMLVGIVLGTVGWILVGSLLYLIFG